MTRQRSADLAPRRAFLRRVLAALGAGTTSAVAARFASAQSAPEIAQPDRPDKASFMRRAFEMRDLAMRNGDQGFGGAVVKDGRIVGQAPSRVVTATDPTAHAETEAIRDAARRLGTRSLSGCELYASSRPCPMCEAAAYWAGIARIYVGEPIAEQGPPRLARC